MFSDLPEKLRNCQNHDVFEGAVMGKHINQTRRFGQEHLGHFRFNYDFYKSIFDQFTVNHF